MNNYQNNAIYLDNNATTQCDTRVLEKMLPFFSEIYGNPSNGLHFQGRESNRAIEEARENVAALIEASASEVFFTSGATESNNIAILGYARKNRHGDRKKIITSAVEHKTVLTTCKKLEGEGFEVLTLPVGHNGLIHPDALRNLADKNTLLVSIQAANNEIGTIFPIRELVQITHENGATFHCDAAQAIGKIPFNVDDIGTDMVSLSSHKIYGPKGIGSLYIRGGIRSNPIDPLIYGGGQERGLRPGTSNVPGIVGFGEACRISKEQLDWDQTRISKMRDEFEDLIKQLVPNIKVHCECTMRLPNTSNLCFPDVDADTLIFNAQKIMVGTGSACNSGAIEPSHVLTAIGVTREEANSTLRVSFGRFNAKVDASQAAQELANAYTRLKNQ